MKLQEFIADVHKKTYASGKEPEITKEGAKQFIVKQGDYEYIDTYFGGEKFIGFEVVKEKGKAIWGMNYYGDYIPSAEHKKEFGDFLKEMLIKNKPGMLLRGPKSYKKKEWSYRYSYKGSFKNFTANEFIKYKGKLVYKAYISGGNIK